MNKLFKVFSMVVMLVMGGQAMAQTRGAMFLGVSFPIMDFAEYEGSYNNFALNTRNGTDAAADMGYNAGLKGYFNVGVKGLGVMVSADGFYNGPNKELKKEYREQEGVYYGVTNSGYANYNSTPIYVNVPVMLGLNYIYHFNPNLGIYVEAGAGGNMRLITDMEYVIKGTLMEESELYEYDRAFSFAYQAGIGLEVAKHLVIGLSFYDLGSADVETVHTYTTNYLELDRIITVSHPETYGTIRPIMVLGRIGFSF